MKLQCLIKSRHGGKYNREMDFTSFGHGIVSVVEDFCDVTPECAATLVATGNFIRVDEIESFITDAGSTIDVGAAVSKAEELLIVAPTKSKRKG